ncbi:hypothetical protein H9P43_000197 [Blastocladiella emersonii ATCC 22665]|nr:hypothetical protein H9P43_000197 [Blastocladiella emersonii ATCC 22665]
MHPLHRRGASKHGGDFAASAFILVLLTVAWTLLWNGLKIGQLFYQLRGGADPLGHANAGLRDLFKALNLAALWAVAATMTQETLYLTSFRHPDSLHQRHSEEPIHASTHELNAPGTPRLATARARRKRRTCRDVLSRPLLFIFGLLAVRLASEIAAIVVASRGFTVATPAEYRVASSALWLPVNMSRGWEICVYALVTLVGPTAFKLWVARTDPRSSTATIRGPLYPTVALALAFWVGALCGLTWASLLLVVLLFVNILVFLALVVLNYRRGTLDALRGHFDAVYFYYAGYWVFGALGGLLGDIGALFVGGRNQVSPVYQVLSTSISRTVMGFMVMIVEVSVETIFGRNDLWISFGHRLLEDILVTSLTLETVSSLDAAAMYSVTNLVIVLIRDTGFVEDALFSAWARFNVFAWYYHANAPPIVKRHVDVIVRFVSGQLPDPAAAARSTTALAAAGGKSAATLPLPPAQGKELAPSGGPPVSPTIQSTAVMAEESSPPQPPPITTLAPPPHALPDPLHAAWRDHLRVQVERTQHTLTARLATLASATATIALHSQFPDLVLSSSNGAARVTALAGLVISAVIGHSVVVWILEWKLRHTRDAVRLASMHRVGGAGGGGGGGEASLQVPALQPHEPDPAPPPAQPSRRRARDERRRKRRAEVKDRQRVDDEAAAGEVRLWRADFRRSTSPTLTLALVAFATGIRFLMFSGTSTSTSTSLAGSTGGSA